MKILSKKLVMLSENRVAHYCPACKTMHSYQINKPQPNGAQWSFDGNAERPTFLPSMRISDSEDGGKTWFTSCHYFLRAGKLEYCGDCAHDMKGQTIELPEFPENFF